MLLEGQLGAGGFQYWGNKAMETSSVQQSHMHVSIHLFVRVLTPF